ncbi:MAG: GNAT family N-acetyltransferase [Bacteroidota bacterium]
MSIYLETERLILRTLEPSHGPLVLRYYQENATFFKPWLPAFDDDFISLGFQTMRLVYDKKAYDRGSKINLYIFTKENNQVGALIGDISFSNIIRGVFQSCFVGYKMAQEANGKGYMTEALAHSIEYVFREFNLHRVEANIMPRNLASQAVVKKLGFQQEGFSEKYLKINGQWEDHLRFALLNERKRS